MRLEKYRFFFQIQLQLREHLILRMYVFYFIMSLPLTLNFWSTTLADGWDGRWHYNLSTPTTHTHVGEMALNESFPFPFVSDFCV